MPRWALAWLPLSQTNQVSWYSKPFLKGAQRRDAAGFPRACPGPRIALATTGVAGSDFLWVNPGVPCVPCLPSVCATSGTDGCRWRSGVGKRSSAMETPTTTTAMTAESSVFANMFVFLWGKQQRLWSQQPLVPKREKIHRHRHGDVQARASQIERVFRLISPRMIPAPIAPKVSAIGLPKWIMQ